MSNFNNMVLDHFYNPRNCGDITPADGIGISGPGDTGIYIRITIKLNKETIEDIKFKCSGCVTAIASASMLTELATGKKIKEYVNINSETISEALGGIPKEKMYCCELAADAFHRAAENYLNSYLELEKHI